MRRRSGLKCERKASILFDVSKRVCVRVKVVPWFRLVPELLRLIMSSSIVAIWPYPTNDNDFSEAFVSVSNLSLAPFLSPVIFLRRWSTSWLTLCPLPKTHSLILCNQSQGRGILQSASIAFGWHIFIHLLVNFEVHLLDSLDIVNYVLAPWDNSLFQTIS